MIQGAAAMPVISEFMANNASGFTDAAGRHSDWIEIHNSASNARNMAGWHLTDSAANLTKWTFPFVRILADGREELRYSPPEKIPPRCFLRA